MFYVLDENHNLVEALDKQGVLNAIETAIADGSLANLVADAAFVNKLKCCVTGGTNRVAFVTQAKYNELAATNGIVENCLYFITDETSVEDLNEILESINKDLQELRGLVGAQISKDANGVLRIGETIIPQKKLVWQGSRELRAQEFFDCGCDTVIGKFFEILYKRDGLKYSRKFAVTALSQMDIQVGLEDNIGVFAGEANGLWLVNDNENTQQGAPIIQAIYQVIE